MIAQEETLLERTPVAPSPVQSGNNHSLPDSWDVGDDICNERECVMVINVGVDVGI